ncbi:MAG: sulfurtransferase [Anaerolineales bacterium]|nr:sulfurtransferase [Anaerolineales bacterium]
MYTTLINCADLAANLSDPQWVIVDARFSLAEPPLGRSNYLLSHIPGAVYAHLDEDLSTSIIKGVTGRHPLPTPDAAARVFSRFGIGPGVQVVAYDDLGGALAAVRVWWMLRWLGHDAVAVLDGGWQSWQKSGYPSEPGVHENPPRSFVPVPRPEMLLSTAQVDVIRQDPAYKVLDARSADRYRGENETIDPVAGHIPGAFSAPYTGNLSPDGAFFPAEHLRAYYQKLLAGIPPERTAAYCGSGVTSIHNILAMLHAGLGEARLYAGSWSEWIADPRRPVATGEN